MIEYRLLGPAEIKVDGQGPPPEMRWRKNLALTVYLIRSSGKPRTRDHIMGLLWAEKPETSARHSLREALRVIRKNAGSENLKVDGEQVSLGTEQVWLDLDQFQDFADAGELRSAWNLVRGSFMEGFSVPDSSGFEDWLLAERTLWNRKAIDVASRLCQDFLHLGQTDEALEVLEQACPNHPDSEELVLLLIRTRTLAGDRAGAIKAFELLESNLELLGARPDVETQRLIESVKREKVWASPSHGSDSVRIDDGRRMPLVGRGPQLGEAIELMSDCFNSGKQTVIVVQGDPGSGKSRFSEELLVRARLDGAHVSTVRAVAADREDPGSGLVGLARGGLLESPGVSGADPAVLAVLGARIPEWREKFPNSPTTENPPKLGSALAEVLRSVTEEDSAVVFVDDAHWLDVESLEALGALVRSLADRPLLLLLSVNSNSDVSPIDELRSRMGREVNGATITMPPLSHEAIVQLSQRILPDYSEDAIERITRRLDEDTAGLPVLLVEILHAVSEGLELERFDGSWPTAFQTLEQTMPGDLPDTVVGAIRVGFRKLSDNAQEVVTVVAVIGGRVDLEQLSLGLDLDASAMENALDEAEWQRWLAAEPRGYSFVARIVREVVVTDLVSPGKRQRILRAVASSPKEGNK
jgi:DNA-binding SARP family transcriptional activator